MPKKPDISSRPLPMAGTSPGTMLGAIPGVTAVLGYNPAGPKEQRDVVSLKNNWTEVKLDDGTLLKIRPAIVDVKRLVGQFNIEGDPIYLVQAAHVINTVAPAHLKKK